MIEPITHAAILIPFKAEGGALPQQFTDVLVIGGEAWRDYARRSRRRIAGGSFAV
jgi:hypothetical protein